ncbi:MAG: MarR family transcriptional regulator, partial [Dehalococcoidia bacterium]|nr:MarR family transcriptional regulator [Dehalococcoidia bacterium]
CNCNNIVQVDIMGNQKYVSKETQLDIDALSNDMRLLSANMRHDAWLAIMTTADAVNRYMVIRLKRTRAASTKMGVLNALVLNDGIMTPTALSKVVFRSKYEITRIINRLEKERLVKKQPSRTDRRERKIIITPKGINFIRQAMPERQRTTEKVTAIFGPEEMDMLSNMLKRLRKHLNNLISEEAAGIK